MIPIYKETFAFEEDISINNFKKKVYLSDVAEHVFQTKKSIQYTVKRKFGNKGLIRLFWSKILIVCTPNKIDEKVYHITYKIDGLSFFLLIMLIGGILVELILIDSGYEKRDIPLFAIPLMGLIYLFFIAVEFWRAKKAIMRVITSE